MTMAKHFSFLLTLSLLPFCLSAQGISGEYFTTTANGEVVLTLTSAGQSQYSGLMIDDNGDHFALNGEAADAGVFGTITVREGAVLYFAVQPEGQGVTFFLIPSDIFGQPDSDNATSFAMQRRGATAAKPPVTAAKVEGQRDQRLVGNWLRSESYTSGEYSFASQWRLILQADGTYLYGDTKVAGGGPGTSAVSGDGGYTRGQWKTENGVIYINENGSGWQAYAGYYVEGNSLLLKFGDGSKQVWSR